MIGLFADAPVFLRSPEAAWAIGLLAACLALALWQFRRENRRASRRIRAAAGHYLQSVANENAARTAKAA
jgi:hypothetical protein